MSDIPVPKIYPQITTKEHDRIYKKAIREERNFGVDKSKHGPGVLTISKSETALRGSEYQVTMKSDRQRGKPFHHSISGFFDSASDAVAAARAEYGLTLSIDKKDKS